MKYKQLFIFVLFLFMVSYNIQAYALDEFIDDYINYDTVQARNDVVRNTTFNAMELEYSFGGLVPNVDIPLGIAVGGFTEVDLGVNHLKWVNNTSVWFDDVDRDEGDRLYKDYGANYFDGGWEYHFRVYVSSTHTQNARCTFMMIGETSEHQTDSINNDRDFVEFFVQWNTVGSEWFVALRSWDEGVATVDSEFEVASGGDFQLNHWYHVEYTKVGDNVTAWFYNDALMTDLDFMLTVVDADITDLRYLHPLNSQDQATGGRAMDLYINKVHNFTSSSGYENNGYFYTTELISGIGGNTIVLLTNATIPTGDILTVEFSIDNITWVDHNGIGGSDTIVAGNESIDLRDLSYGTLYMRFNFTDGADDSTPRLYQIRVITSAVITVGVNVTGAWVEYNFTSIITLVGVNTSTGGNFLNQTYWMDLWQYNVTELGTPAYDVQFNITGLPDGLMCLEIVNFMSYDGSAGHNFYIQVYNYTSASWITIYDIPDAKHPCIWMNATIGCYEQDVIQNGLLQGRYYHPSPANPLHTFMVDYGKLRAFAPFPVTGGFRIYPLILYVIIVVFLLAVIIALKRKKW